MQKAQSADPLRSPTRARAHGDGDTINSIYTPSSLPPALASTFCQSQHWGRGGSCLFLLLLLWEKLLWQGRVSAICLPACGMPIPAGVPIPATGWGPGLFFSTPGLCAEPPSLLRESRPCQRGGYSYPGGGGGNHNERSLGPLLEVANTQAKEPSARDLLADR